MNQPKTGIFEEYMTLRQEMLQLQAFSHQILYWSVLLVIVGLAWYLGQGSKQNDRVSANVFGLSLIGVLVFSFILYESQRAGLYRIGSYIAVFLESGSEDWALQ